MPPGIVDVTLQDLERQAQARATQLGHRLEAFRGTKHHPSCAVAFCHDCRQMVIVSANGEHPFCGYALEAHCEGR